MDEILTPRLRLRALSERDLADFHAYLSDPEVAVSAGWKPQVSRQDSLVLLTAFIADGSQWGIERADTRRLVGNIGLIEDERRYGVPGVRAVAYMLARPAWGQGFATEALRGVLEYAFTRLDLSLVSLYHFVPNQRSLRVAEKCGFRREGVLRLAQKLYDGQLMDSVCYSLTKQEYTHRRL
jgi:putative acetyltransferase